MPIPERHMPREATIVVAASGSLTASGDYNCSGAADDVEIAAALAALPGGGGSVLLLEGTYNTVANITVPANCTLLGVGDATIINADHADITNAVIVGGDNVTVRDMKIQLAAGCGTGAARPNVVYAAGRSQLKLLNLWLVSDDSVADDGSDARQNCVYLNNVDDSSVSGCHMQSCLRHAVYILNGSQSNTIESNHIDSFTSRGVWVDASSYNSIANNIIDGGTHGVLLTGTTTFSTVASNVIVNSEYPLTLNSPQCVAISNTVHNATVNGITTAEGHCSIVGNSVHGSGGVGIAVAASGAVTTGNVVRDSTSYGIQVSTRTDPTTVSGNVVFNSGNHGIYIYRTSRCTVTGNSSYDNDGVNADGICVEGDGVQDADENIISSNACYNNGDNGVEIIGAANADRNLVMGNQLLGNTGAALVDGGANTEIGHNVVA